MTPHKLWALWAKRRDERGDEEVPLAQIASILYNVNRSPGDKERGIPPAPFLSIDNFCVFGNKRTASLAAKLPNPGGDHLLLGAKANKDQWVSYAKGKRGRKPKVVPRKRG